MVTSALRNSCQDLVELSLALSYEQFLSPIDGGWSPRDVIAHLIGWNRLMLEAARSILAGQPPAYFADAPHDYSHINAGFVATYASRSKDELLDELKRTLDELAAFVLALPAGELSAHHEARHHDGEPTSIKRILASLAGDYQDHARQITEWRDKS